MAELVLDDVSRVHADGTAAVDHLSLRVADGELVSLVGPSGCGKSTVLRVVAGLDPLAGGHIRIGGQVVDGLGPAERDVGMVFEHGALYPWLSTADNMAFGLRTRRLPEAEVRERVGAEARVLHLGRLLGRRPRTLAAGEQQRVALARATVRVPKVFLLDEPLSHSDAADRVRLRAEIAQLAHGLGVSTLYVTHDQAEAMAVGDRMAVMRAGHLEQVDEPMLVYGRPANLFVATFVGSVPAGLAPAILRSGPEGTWLTVGEERLRWPGIASGRVATLVGRPLVLATRPEHLREASGEPHDLRLRAVCTRVDRLGAETLVACTVDVPAVALAGERTPPAGARAELVARFPPVTRVRAGDRIELAVDTGAVHLFDALSGEAVWHGA